MQTARVVLAMLGVLAAVPAISVAAARIKVPALLYASARVRGYELYLTAFGARGKGLLDIELSRALPDGSYQDHQFEVTKGVRFRETRDLRFATVRANLGGYGSVELTLSSAKSKGSRGCNKRIHAGFAHGSLRLTPGGSYFGTIALSRLGAALSIPQGCQTSPRRAIRNTSAPKFIDASERGALGARSQLTWDGENGDGMLVDLIRASGRVRVKDEISVTSDAFKLTESPDLSSATVTATGPFLSGIAHYTATRHPGPDHSTGTVSGTLMAVFDTPGPRSLVGPGFDAYLSG